MLSITNISLLASGSLRAIDDWLANSQGNLNGTVRTAFKQVELTYGGNNTYIGREPSSVAAGEMIPEQTLTVGSTRLSWKQGSMVTSTQDTHFGIQGEGFFAVVDPRAFPNGTLNTAASVTNSVRGLVFRGEKIYLTRDGEFHFALVPNINTTTPILVDNHGFPVLADAGPLAPDNVYHFIEKVNFDSPTTRSGAAYTGLNAERPSVVLATRDAVGAGAIVGAADLSSYNFSNFGSTYFTSDSSNTIKTIINGTDEVLDRRDYTSIPSESLLVQSALEASNTNVERNIIEMATLTKVYNSMIQVIKVYNNGLDEILGFIK